MMPECRISLNRKLKGILISVVVLLTITYPLVNFLQYCIYYVDLQPSSFWFALGVSILVSVSSTALHVILQPRVSYRRFRRPVKVLMEKTVIENKGEEESLVSAYNKLEHKFDELCALGEKVQTAIAKELSPKYRPELMAFSLSQSQARVRSSDTLTPSALDMSPIEPDSFAEGKSQRMLKTINAFSSPFSHRKHKDTHLRCFKDTSFNFSLSDNRDVFEKATRNIPEADIAGLSDAQISDTQVLGDSHEETVSPPTDSELPEELDVEH